MEFTVKGTSAPSAREWPSDPVTGMQRPIGLIRMFQDLPIYPERVIREIQSFLHRLWQKQLK